MQYLQLTAVYRVKQQGHVEAARQAVLQRADVALSDLVAALPPHRRDLALIEALNKAIGRHMRPSHLLPALSQCTAGHQGAVLLQDAPLLPAEC